jgi:SPX domain protein involved in polyphosphate accumulation
MENSAAAYFRRYEQKYHLNQFQYGELLKVLDGFAGEDHYGQTTIYSIYFDNPVFGITRKSLGKSPYKEKLRLRSYGIPRDTDSVYLELKKKFRGVTYKKRIAIPFSAVQGCLDSARGDYRTDNYIAGEIYWILRYYKPSPQLMICYERRAFRGLENDALRITLDSNVRWRDADFDFKKGSYGNPLLGANEYLMELKVAASIPLFLTSHFARLNIFPVPFSKYRTACECLMNNRRLCYA